MRCGTRHSGHHMSSFWKRCPPVQQKVIILLFFGLHPNLTKKGKEILAKTSFCSTPKFKGLS